MTVAAFPHADAIEETLTLAAERCADLTPLVYPRLFGRLPHVEALFVRDTTGAVRGEMLARVFEAILDYIGERRYAQAMIGTEAVTHSYYDVPTKEFGVFFEVVAETVRKLLGSDWTPAHQAAWGRLVYELDLYVKNGTAPVAQVAAAL
jgi:hemoglobin-like flavoprotein